MRLAHRPSFHHKPRLRILLLDIRDFETPFRQKDLRAKVSLEDVLGVVMVGVGVVVVVVIGGGVIEVEVVDE